MPSKGYKQKDLQRLYNLVESDEVMDCIVHHVKVALQSENELKDDISNCPSKKVESSQLGRYFRTLSNAGVIRCLIVPENDVFNYRLSGMGKEIKSMVSNGGSKYSHPKVR